MSTRPTQEMRRQVRRRAKDRCEYCLLPETFSGTTHQVDHVVAVKHGGTWHFRRLHQDTSSKVTCKLKVLSLNSRELKTKSEIETEGVKMQSQWIIDCYQQQVVINL